MKIAIVVDDYAGGAGNVAQLLACELSKNHNIVFMTVDKRSNPRYTFPNNVIEYSFVKGTGNSTMFKIFDIQRWIRNLIVKEEKVDIVISFLNTISIMSCFALIGSRIPIIVSERSDPRQETLSFKWNLLRRIAYYRAQKVSIQFDDFKMFDRGRFKNKCIVTPNIVDIPSCYKNNWDSHGVFRFVSMGRYNDVKRFPLMIDCFMKCHNKYPNIELHLFGKGEKKEAIENYVQEQSLQNCVFIHDNCDTVYETLVKYDCYLMTSQREGFPNALTEAMAVGLPSVSFACHNGIREMCQYGNAGICIEQNDMGMFVDGMCNIVESRELREKLGVEAKNIISIYSKEHVMSIWNQCISEGVER